MLQYNGANACKFYTNMTRLHFLHSLLRKHKRIRWFCNELHVVRRLALIREINELPFSNDALMIVKNGQLINMTKTNKANLLHFVTRPGMYINPIDDKNIVSFIHGYEVGTKYKCNFTQLLKDELSHKYKISYRNDGWPGQITRFAGKHSLDWVEAFQMIGLEILKGTAASKN